MDWLCYIAAVTDESNFAKDEVLETFFSLQRVHWATFS
jgi:uncharacterized protein YdaU (DUF1376 family)